MLQKKLAIAALAGFATLSLSTIANAALPGFYIGGEAGWGDTHYTISDLALPGVTTASSKSTGFAGRIFVGYQFDCTWGAELGYTLFSNAKFDNGAGFVPGIGTVVSANAKVEQYAVDLVGTGTLPLGNCFNLYGKLGAAYVHAKATATVNFPTTSVSENDDGNKVFPTASVGVNYDLTPNIPIGIEYTRIQKVGSTNIKSSDLVAAVISYHFG